MSHLASVSGLGPHGEFSASVDQLVLSDEDAARARAGRFKVAIVLHTTTSDWSKLQIAGIRAALERYGASVAEIVDCDFGSDRQIQALGELAERRPDAIISLPVDNVRTAEAHARLAEVGIKLVLMDNAPIGLVARKHYVSVISADNFGNGQVAAELLAREVAPGGVVGIVGFGVDFFVTNEREIAFRKWMKEHRPDLVLRGVEFADIKSAGPVVVDFVAANPDVAGLFVVWDVPAMEAVRALRSIGRVVPLVTVDLGTEIATEVANGTFVKGVAAQAPFDLGVAEATAAIMALVGSEPPSWIALPASSVTRANVIEAYETIWRAPAPEEIRTAVSLAE